MSLKKVFLTLLLLIVVSFSFCLPSFSFPFFKKATYAPAPVQSVTTYRDVQNNLWCVTFQLVWNELSEKFVKGPVNFVGGNPPIADELNKKLYTSDILSEESYYTTYGKISKKLKKQIEKNIKKKFNETSDLLGMVNWEAKNSYLFYSILKKNFNFLTAFDKLVAAPFNGSEFNVKYFGVDEKSDAKLRKNVDVLFYNSPDEYAVRLQTKEKEDVILYRTDKEDTFENYFADVSQNQQNTKFFKEDVLNVPELKVDKTISYDELCGRKIEGTKFVVSQALQTIQFNLDNKGGSLKSEAIITIMKTALEPQPTQPRYFLFNKPFVLFLMEQGKEKPYYAMKVNDTDFLVKE
ncbi:MAG: hypothetical protein E7Z90_00205 [Cyanobacteria bacterium SIG29]|nr:hypothetical protein [Cyanobacteria bacterium SIG29]